MDSSTLVLLIGTIFAASSLQAATGIGYGVIAGPVFLIIFNSVEALQLSVMHNLAIAVLLFPFLRAHVNGALLATLVPGSVLGLLTGFFLQTIATTHALKVIAMLMVAFVTFALLRDILRTRETQPSLAAGKPETLSVGAVAGFMGGIVAMPGPVISTWMSLRGWRKEEVRATVLAFFIFAYGTVFTFYFARQDFDTHTLLLGVRLLPVVGLGLVVGTRATRYLSEDLYRRILLAVLILTLMLSVSDWLLLGRSE
jgi:uncharacterized membrane protein YfcA